MEKQIYDEKNGLWYKLNGDYYLPCLTLPKEERRSIGVWGQRHGRYLKEHKRTVYNTLLISEGVTEKLKTENHMEWIRRMNNIRNRAMETVNQEIIYTA